MRVPVLLFLVVFSFFASAQDADFPDYRSKKENFLRLRDATIRNDLATFTMAGIDESMNKPPLKTIPMTSFGTNSIAFEGNGIQVIVQAAGFNITKHKLTYYNEKHLVKIDNKPYYGNYGKAPTSILQSLIVLIDKDTVAIPAAALADLYDPSFAYKDASGVQRSQNRVYLSPDNRTIYIYLLSRNNGGTEVTWVIRDKKYLQRVVDFGFLK
ncbi:MAG TPA: hypothetical protein VJ647_01455 [Chitinophagaceae bacterium]|nr:hypothetical protein [Chitinophagaceae bacterium]